MIKHCYVPSSFCHFFSATNGVKQGGVLSPRLFNVYLNELLSKLRENGLGCHMNGQFVGTFIYMCMQMILPY